MDVVLALLVIAVLGLLVLVGASVRVVTQYERGVVLRFGRLHGDARPPGLTVIAPGIDRMHKVNMQIVTMPVPAQEGITRDNVTVKDRKSTRLNSSHANISYAVFCLKKKT